MKNLSSATPHTTSTDRDGIMEKKGVRERGEGGWEANTAPTWTSSAGERDWVIDNQGVEAPRPQFFMKKDTQ